MQLTLEEATVSQLISALKHKGKTTLILTKNYIPELSDVSPIDLSDPIDKIENIESTISFVGYNIEIQYAMEVLQQIKDILMDYHFPHDNN